MNCTETRYKIEEIEDLRDSGHTCPSEVGTHLGECPYCREYYRNSQELERIIFAKIKEVSIPPQPSIKTLIKRKRSTLQCMIWGSLFSAAAVLILVLFFQFFNSNENITEKLVVLASSDAIKFMPVDEKGLNRISSEIYNKYETALEYPAEFDVHSIQEAALVGNGSDISYVFNGRKNGKAFMFFVFAEKHATWDCCSLEKCYCLSTEEHKVMRWNANQLGYLVYEKT